MVRAIREPGARWEIAGPAHLLQARRSTGGGPALRPVPQRLGELLAQGATLVLNLMERLTPGVAAVAEAIEMVTGAQTVCNVYCSWDRQQAFSSHFDNTDVFVLQIEGHKR